MQASMTIKPQIHKYLLLFVEVAAAISVGLLLLSLLMFRNISFAREIIGLLFLGLWLAVPLWWLYGVVTKFKRFTVIVTDSCIQIPSDTGIKCLSLETLDKARTLSYMSRKNLDNWMAYSFWLVNGERCYISKFLYSSSEIKIILEKLGCL